MKLIFSIVIVCISYSVAYSQIGFTVGPLLGASMPTIDYAGEPSDFYSGSKYGLKTGMTYGVISKIKLGPIKSRLGINFSSFENNGQAETGKTGSSVEIKNNLFTFFAGLEFGMSIPKSPVKPYFAADVLFSSISGEYKFQGTSHVDSNPHSIQSGSRTGLGFSLGAEISIAGVSSFDFNLRYNLHNLFGKEFKSYTNRIDGYTSLNDLKDPNYSASDKDHFIGNDRTIATIQLQIAFLFGF